MPLRSLKQFQEQEALSRYQVELLLQDGLEHVLIGSRKMIPEGAFERFTCERTVKACRDPEKGPASGFIENERATTFIGAKTVAAGSARRALQIANALKSSSRNGSSPDKESPGRVVRLRPS